VITSSGWMPAARNVFEKRFDRFLIDGLGVR
jgi:hypothetical protein